MTGGVIGDSLMGLEHQQSRLRRRLSPQSRELARQRAEIRQLPTPMETE